MATRAVCGSLLVLLAVVAAVGLTACGNDGTENAGTTVESTTTSTPSGGGTETGSDAIETLEPAVDAADQGTDPAVQLAGTASVPTMYDFLTDVIRNVDAYWSDTFQAAGLSEPYVKYDWLAPGESVTTGCQRPDGGFLVTDDDTALYCKPDDTIYISQQFVYNLWQGIFGGVQTGRHPADFGVAYVVAHEYAHNIQAEVGIVPTGPTVQNLKLQADCLAGTWANSAYYRGLLEVGDVEEAISTADIVGDYNFFDVGHHGTPSERVEAWTLGYNSGNPADCGNTYVP